MHNRVTAPQSPIAAALATLVSGGDRERSGGGGDGDIRTARHVDLGRFAGTWYVVASIPTPIERDACNAREHYRLCNDGTIDAVYTFRKGTPDSRDWTLRRTGIVRDDASNAVWDLRYAGPLTADYRIVHVDDDYGQAIIGRNKRDYAWILAREPRIDNRDLFEHVRRLREQGYDSGRLRTVPQHWD